MPHVVNPWGVAESGSTTRKDIPAMNLDTTTPVSVLLDKAADLIEQRGWATGSGWGDRLDGKLCLEGGILAAMGTPWDDDAEAEYDAFRECPAYQAVLKHVQRENLAHYNELWMYNDRAATKDDVVRVLRNTAREQREQGQ